FLPYKGSPEAPVKVLFCRNHQIRACRLPYHLVKCRKNNQKIARELATCPYNARHRVPKQELKLHIATCENKVSPEVLEVTSSRGDPKNRIKEVTAWQCPPPEEDWEADAAECPAPPFVFGTSYSGERSLGTILIYSVRLPMAKKYSKCHCKITTGILQKEQQNTYLFKTQKCF
uniref:CHHC U11-48K-type domain-containing protein n=1 Tax=Podarcis muralis TaxID=64176 RepID=A0A670IVC8_PODMU